MSKYFKFDYGLIVQTPDDACYGASYEVFVFNVTLQTFSIYTVPKQLAFGRFISEQEVYVSQEENTQMKIEIGKHYKTKSGKLVRRILCTDRNSSYPVVLEFEDGAISCYTIDGKYDMKNSTMDLVKRSPFEDFKIDDKFLVSDYPTDRNGGPILKRYFAGLDNNGIPLFFTDGLTSWNTDGNTHSWKYFMKADESK